MNHTAAEPLECAGQGGTTADGALDRAGSQALTQRLQATPDLLDSSKPSPLKPKSPRHPIAQQLRASASPRAKPLAESAPQHSSLNPNSTHHVHPTSPNQGDEGVAPPQSSPSFCHPSFCQITTPPKLPHHPSSQNPPRPSANSAPLRFPPTRYPKRCRRSALATALHILLLTLLPATAAPPNVLFIAVDDLRPELNCYGETHMVTPHIDSLASQGRLFRNHYVAVPTCGASRYALMTGLRPTAATDTNGAFNFMPTSLPANPESWVDLLRRNGWHTASMGKLTHEPDGFRWDDSGTYDIGRFRGTNPDMRHSWNEIIYDHDKWGAQRYPLFAYADGTGRVRNVSAATEIGVDDQGNSLPDDAYPDGQMAEAAIDKLREFADDGTRFCLAVGFYKPHLPFNAPKAYWDLYNPATLPAPSPANAPSGANSATTTNSGEINAYSNQNDRDLLRHAYFACVSYIDAQVGKVLAELDTLGLADNTIVILWGDHGWCLDDYGLIGKHKVLERSLESPLIIRPPADMRPEVFAGIQADGVVATIDIYPTIAELCGLTPPASVQGESLVPMLRNPFAPGKSHAYGRWGSLTTLRTSDWRLINASGDYDLYNLSRYRYERADVSGSNPALVSSLSANLSDPGTRPGTTYADWTGGNPLLTDPIGDADNDGSPNALEYAGGTDALDPNSRPTGTLSTEDLTSLGFSDQEIVYSFTAALDPNDLALSPDTSTDRQSWSFAPLKFLDATVLGNNTVRLRFRLANPAGPERFFRFSGHAVAP